MQDSPTKSIDAKLKGSVTQFVRKERNNITRIQLEGGTIENTIGSLAVLFDTLWFGNAVKAHLQGQCLDMHKCTLLVARSSRRSPDPRVGSLRTHFVQNFFLSF